MDAIPLRLREQQSLLGEADGASTATRSSKALSRIEKLPDELLQQIAVSLCAKKDSAVEELRVGQRALRALCLASKPLRSIALPYLYETFLTLGGSAEITPFIKTACSDPYLAAHIRRVEITRTMSAADPALSNQELDLLCNTLRRNMSDANTFYRIAGRMADGCITSQSYALLSVAKQMRFLELTNEPRHSRYDGDMCFRCAQDMVHGIGMLFAESKVRDEYPKLQHIVLCQNRDDPGEYTHYRSILPLLHFPALEKFEGDGLCFEGHQFPWTKPLPSSSLKEIRLANADLDTPAVIDIIGCTDALMDLRVCWAGNELFTQNFWQMDPPSLLRSLYPHKDRLERLELSTKDGAHMTLEGQQALGCLADFAKLHTLYLDEHLLRGTADWSQLQLAKTLPPSIKCFSVESHDDADSALAKICAAVGTSELTDLADFLVIFRSDSWAGGLSSVEGPFNQYDFGFFEYSPGDSWHESPMGFRAHALKFGSSLPHLLAQFATQLAQNRSIIISYMMTWQAPVAVDEEGKVVIHGLEEEREEIMPEIEESSQPEPSDW